MEIEYFVRPDDGAAKFDGWLEAMQGWVRQIGLNPDHVRLREHEKDELSHYSSRTVDFEYLFPEPMGWKELYGLANRTDFDLGKHQEYSGEDLRYFEQETGERFVPHVIEPTFGVDRTILVVLLDAYDEEADRRRQRQAGHANRPAARPDAGAVQGGDSPFDEEAGADRSGTPALPGDPAEHRFRCRL